MEKRLDAPWWSQCNCPYTGCPRLALPADERPEGCRACWAPGFLSGRTGRTIHGGEDPGKLMLWPGRLAKCLRARKPQRYGWILGEPAEVARLHPEYLAACVGVAMARPDHGFGVLTSDPAGIVEFCRWLMAPFADHISAGASGWARAVNALEDLGSIGRWHIERESAFPPQNWLWLISASNQPELDERAPYAAELARMGWQVGLHLEPMLEPVDLDNYGVLLAKAGDVEARLNMLTGHVSGPDEMRPDMRWSWVAVGSPKGHTPSDEEVDTVGQAIATMEAGRPLCETPVVSELDWYRDIRDQCAAAGVKFWLKNPTEISGKKYRELPKGWPNVVQ
uniref:DUF5131 family protein n=2 Tax=viral metagenome TaxID=1070528 RepID=A0A6M3X7Z5_9ZZZZ